jgi:DNA repair protein RecO (recombination protein O)
MTSFSTPAIIIRRVDYGDFDLILTFLSLHQGKISAIAKAAKKSTRRFAGLLELFSILSIVCSAGKKQSLAVLQEASLVLPVTKIRSDIRKTAYASYWAEIIDRWSEEGQPQTALYHLFAYVLKQLDSEQVPADVLSILFQIRFLTLSGHRPNLEHCSVCRRDLNTLAPRGLQFDLYKGGLVCSSCSGSSSPAFTLNRGAIKQLQWMDREELETAGRVRSSSRDAADTLAFLEAFLPYHLGREPRSLKFLRRIREQG